MKYAQLKLDSTFDRELPETPINFDINNYCTAEALVKDGKATTYRVVPLLDIAPPEIDPTIEIAVLDGVEYAAGQWQYKWVVNALSAEVIAANLLEAKTAKNLQINQWRAQANQTYFTHGGKQVACDALSRSDIDAVAGSISLNADFPAGFPGAWKAVDNTYIVLADVDAFKAMYASMTNQGTINFGQSQTLKAALAAATTLAEVNAIVWA
jgi:hypothetical protein